MNIERGDTFIVDERSFRGAHFTCVGTGTHNGDACFYAGDTCGRMFVFQRWSDGMNRVYQGDDPRNRRYRGTISGEAVIRE